jgi:hypothetical protein
MEEIEIPNYKNQRGFFTDSWNSVWHFYFGILASQYIFIIPLFIIYELIDIYDKNIFIDIGEFIIGYLTAICIGRLGHRYFV